MVFGFLGAWLGGGPRMPSDRVTRIPRSAKKAAASAIAGLQQTLDQISALPGIADIKQTRRVPRGFYGLVKAFYSHLEEYNAIARKHLPVPETSKRPGEPGGTAACQVIPMGVHSIEALNLYHVARSWRDFPEVAKRLAEQGEQLFKDIQAGHSGKNPEKIRMGGKAVRQGRLAAAQRQQPCPFLDTAKQRCRVWDQRPLVCRMHHPTTPLEWSEPRNEKFPDDVRAINIRPPVKIQVALAQLDKRVAPQHSPFLPAGVLQVLETTEGQVLQEVGEAPLRLQQDGSVAQPANRNVKHAKKFQKNKQKRGQKKRA